MKVPSTTNIVSTFFACMLAISCTPATADSIQLRNGRHLQGKYLGGSTTTISFMTAHSVEYFQTTDVLALIFDNSPEPSANGLQPNGVDGSSPSVLSPIVAVGPTNDQVRLIRKRPSRTEVRENHSGFRYIVD